MPSGRAHAAITTLAGAGLAAWAWGQGWPRPDMIALCAGCLAGIVISPDLDVDQPTRPHYIMARFGWLPAGLWRIVWLPYSRMIPHRSPVSHAPLLSTAIRLAYLAALAWLLLALTGRPWPGLPAWAPLACAGLAVSDGLHWLADVLVSWYRRRKRRTNVKSSPSKTP